MIDTPRHDDADEDPHDSEQRLRTVLDALPVGVWLTDADGAVVVDNPAGARIWGARHVGRGHMGSARAWWSDSGLPVASDEWSLQRALTKGETSLNEVIDIETAGGERKTILSSAVPIHDGAGTVRGAVVVNEDISQLKAIEAALRQSEARFRALANTLPAMVWTADPDGTITFANDQWLLYCGLTPEENARNWPHLVLHPDDMERCIEQWTRALHEGTDYEIEVRNRRHDGEYRWFLTRAVPVRDGQGRVTSWFGTTTDIHARRLAEAERERLLASEQAARAAAERAAERTTRLQTVTAALAEALTSEQVAEILIGQVVAALDASAGAVGLVVEDGAAVSVLHAVGYPPGLVESWQWVPIERPTLFTDAARTGMPLWMETQADLQARYPDRRTAQRLGHSYAAVPLRVRGRTLGVMGFSFDHARTFPDDERAFVLALAQQCAQALERARLYDSERAARAEAQAALEMRDQFLSAISHDLRTPITTIKGMTQALQRQARGAGPSPAGAALNSLAIIERSASTLTRMVGELTDLTHLQSGQQLELDLKPTDLVALARRGTEEAQQTTTAHSIRVETDAGALIGEWDGDRLGRVLANLLSNAIKFSPNGGAITVTLTAESRDSAGWARLSVRDEGIGIPTEDLPRVFDRYYRGGNVAGQIAGTGIGLAGSRQIVEQHGGSIEASSNEGTGSTFTVQLPLRPILPL